MIIILEYLILEWDFSGLATRACTNSISNDTIKGPTLAENEKNVDILNLDLTVWINICIFPVGKKTPGKGSKTPSGGDRFIPNRTTTQFELGHYKVMQEANPDPEDVEMMSPSKLEYQKVMGENLHGDIQNKKIISYKTKAPAAPEGNATVYTSDS